MYNDVYERMVESGVAIKLENEVMLDKDGKIVETKEEMFGRPTRYIVTKPEQCLFVDETGCNTNQLVDGLAAGERYVCANDGTVEGNMIGDTTDIHFTVLCFTSGTGEPVMCAIILKSDRDINDITWSVKLGIDITKDIVSGRSVAEVMEKNTLPDGALCGGPVCYFQGKEIPCFVAATPSASITSELLVSMLKVIDDKKIYDRSDSSLPFLLLDGHHSRTRLPFLKYINNEASKWMVCIGVPYATHLWQVADSSELNGSFKIALTKAKKRYLTYKPVGKKRFNSCDIIPLVNQSWKLSFGRSLIAKKAVANRGWGPLNYVLLDSKKLIRFDKSPPITNNHSEKRKMDAIDTVNLTGEVAGGYMAMIFQDQKRTVGITKRMEEQRRKNLAAENDYENLKDKSNWTSGVIAADGKYCLTRPEVLMQAQNHDDNKNSKQKATVDRMHIRKINKETKLTEAIKRFRSKVLSLRLEDYHTILRHFHKEKEPKVKEKLAGVKEQFDEWGRARLLEYLRVAGIVDNDSENGIENENNENSVAVMSVSDRVPLSSLDILSNLASEVPVATAVFHV